MKTKWPARRSGKQSGAQCKKHRLRPSALFKTTETQHPVLDFQRVMGNRVVTQMMRGSGVIQGKFSIKNGVATDDGTGEIYFISATVDYGSGKKAYEMFQFGKDPIFVDVETMEKIDSALVKKAKDPNRMETEDSDVSDSDDDERSELTPQGKMSLLIRMGKRKKKQMLKRTLAKTGGHFALHGPREKKILAVNRLFGDKTLSDIAEQETVSVGSQQLRIGEGTGFFIQPGGNPVRKTKGSSKISEPPAEYEKLFPSLLKLGKDPMAPKIFKNATKTDLTDNPNIQETDMGKMMLHFMGQSAEEMEKLGSRSQLTENMGKASLIGGFSEFSRGMSAQHGKEEIPYDASILFKQGLQQIGEGKETFQSMFFKGKGGEDSVFLGAPSKEKTTAKIGGSEILQDPFKYPIALERQMKIFPHKKSDFKKTVRTLKSTGKGLDVGLTPEIIEQQLKNLKAKQLQEAKDVLEDITNAKIPTSSVDRFNFWNDENGFIKSRSRMLARLRQGCERTGNTEGKDKITEAETALKKKEDDAKEVVEGKRRATKKPSRYEPETKKKKKGGKGD